MNPSKRYHYKYFKILERMVVTLAHTHTLSDPDSIFTIDPTTREITTTESKIVLMQYDHNSEIFTFQIPRLVEGHDMSLCSKIEIHYTNINTPTSTINSSLYPSKYQMDFFCSRQKIVANLPVPAYLIDNQRYIGCHIDLAQPTMCHAI